MRMRVLSLFPAVVDNGNSQVIQATVPCWRMTNFTPDAKRSWASHEAGRERSSSLVCFTKRRHGSSGRVPNTRG